MSLFRIPTQVRMAPGCLDELPHALSTRGLRSPLLVADPGLPADLLERVQGLLAGADIPCAVFRELEPNPRTTTVERAARQLRAGGDGAGSAHDSVIALGGGSALDCAKAAAVLATNEGSARELSGHERFSADPLPMIAIPTTCGTGSEVTWVAVISDQEGQQKISIKGERMFPDLALVDHDLLRTLPASLVASTGMDALTHALEATTVNVANPVSDALAEKAIALLFTYLPRAVQDISGDVQAREAVMRASTLAGLAFGNADVGAVHCLSETLGGIYDVAHGLANAVLLGPVMRSHGAAVEERLSALATTLPAGCLRGTGVGSQRLLASLELLAQEVGLPGPECLGLRPEDHARVAAGAERNGSNDSNPRVMGAAEYLAILAAL